MSRLLFLLPSVPEPQDAGARIRNRGLMRLLGEDHEVHAIAFGTSAGASDLDGLTRRARVVPPPPRRTLAGRAAHLVHGHLPDMAQRLWSPDFAHAVRCFVNQAEYHAVQAEGVEMARYLGLVRPDRRIYDAHNAEFLLQRRFAEAAGPLPAVVYSRLQWRRLERFERQVVRTSRVTLAVSHHDANQLIALGGPGVDVRVVPNGVQADAYPFMLPRPDQGGDLLFLGKLDFRPNAEAVRWFLAEVLPRLTRARLFAVGESPPGWLVSAGQHDDRVAVTGYVADERPYLARCAAIVLPLQIGGGSRMKALIAMASGLPIVSTRVGMEGLEAEPDVHFVRADTTAEWVAGLERLLGDISLRQRLARAGRELVEQRYDWSALRADVRSAYAWLPA